MNGSVRASCSLTIADISWIMSKAAKTLAGDITDIGQSFQQTFDDAFKPEEGGEEADSETQTDGRVVLDLLKVDEQVGQLADGAASFFGSLLGDIGEAAQKIATTAAGEISETFRQGMSDISELSKSSEVVKAASNSLQVAASKTKKFAESGFEITAKDVLDTDVNDGSSAGSPSAAATNAIIRRSEG